MRYFLLTATLLIELVCAEAKEITFTQHVAPIIFQNCTSCHRPGEAGPFALMSYNDVKKRGKLIQLVTEDRIMPPWHAQKSTFKFHGDRRLSEEQISTIAEWVESGRLVLFQAMTVTQILNWFFMLGQNNVAFYTRTIRLFFLCFDK